jgi:DNA gyrase subunit B
MSDLFASGSAAPSDSYDASAIEVLEGLEPVRRRPGMYIGGTDARALHHLAAEVIDNSMDEAVAGHASRIEVILEPGNRLTVSDNGRGIPVDPHPKYPGKSALEVILTTLHSGGKFEGKAYSTSGGLHGVGVSVVNALSDYLLLKIYRGGEAHEMRFERGDAVSPLKVTGKAPLRDNGVDLTGTQVTFLPSLETFAFIEFDRKTLEHRLRELAFLNSGVTIYFRDLREVEPFEEILHYDGGIEAFEHLDGGGVVAVGLSGRRGGEEVGHRWPQL